MAGSTSRMSPAKASTTGADSRCKASPASSSAIRLRPTSARSRPAGVYDHDDVRRCLPCQDALLRRSTSNTFRRRFSGYVGHRYLGGLNALALGAESRARSARHPRLGIRRGRVGENNASGVWGGLKLYFGPTDKPPSHATAPRIQQLERRQSVRHSRQPLDIGGVGADLHARTRSRQQGKLRDPGDLR